MKENQDRNIQNVYQQIVEISKKYQVKKVVLFGSRARGTNMPKSDIDLAIYGCADFGGLSDSLNEDLWSLLKLDIINMDNKYVSPELVSEIEKDGVVLYESICLPEWYRACVNYIHSVPEYNCALEQERFTEKAAIAAIYQLKRYYDEKHFAKDPDYIVRMDRLLSVIKDHETDEEMDQWKIWLKYFVTMGGGEWNEFWEDVK